MKKNISGQLIIIQLFFLFSFFVPARAVLAANSDFLIPGISFGEIKFRAGSKARYLVISEVYDLSDTSVVTFSVLDTLEGKTVLEIGSSPWPDVQSEMIVIRVVMSDSLRGLDSLINIDSVLEEVMIKDGEDPFREATKEEIKNFELDNLLIHTKELKEVQLPPVKLNTPAGAFICEVKEYSGKSERKINLGGNEAVRVEEERNTLWISNKVPFWGLVQSEVRRKTYTKMNLPFISDGMLNSKETFLKSILISYRESCE